MIRVLYVLQPLSNVLTAVAVSRAPTMGKVPGRGTGLKPRYTEARGEMGISSTQRRSSVLGFMGPRLQPSLPKAGSRWRRAGAVGQEEESRRAGQGPGATGGDSRLSSPPQAQVLLSCRTVGQV